MFTKTLRWLYPDGLIPRERGYHVPHQPFWVGVGSWLGLIIAVGAGLAIVSAALVFIFPA